MTIYRPVPGYADLYAGMDGSIVCGWRGKQLKSQVHKRSGYLYVNIPQRKDVRRGGYRNVHVLVAEAFLGTRPPDIQIRHIDHDKTNASIENLCFGTAKDNTNDSIVSGRHQTNRRLAKTECVNGHKYTPESTRWTAQGHRQCRTCDSIMHKNLRAEARRNRVGQPRPAGIRKTHCPQEHEYTPENTYTFPRTGKRACRICRKMHATKHRQHKAQLGSTS